MFLKTFAGGMRGLRPPRATRAEPGQDTSSAALPPCGRRSAGRRTPSAERRAQAAVVGAGGRQLGAPRVRGPQERAAEPEPREPAGAEPGAGRAGAGHVG